jgi:two-component sensor histidine kinase
MQVEQDGLTWVRKALPVVKTERRVLGGLIRWPVDEEKARSALILVHDATEALRTQQELESKMAMIREVHHRVKNNLQVIASIMRMQARRAANQEAKDVLEESVNRVLSVAVVHEFLSRNAQGTINLREIANRISSQTEQGLISPDKEIHVGVAGPDIWLPAERATQCALVINELVQNAIEHGMVEQDSGEIAVELVDEGERVSIIVVDNGIGLPEGFDVSTDANLGLRIVQNMVQRDLRGTFELLSQSNGTQAIVQFDKSKVGGGG